MKVLHITNAYPSEKEPVRGIFIKDQINSLKKNKNIEIDVQIIDVPNSGIISYLKMIFILFKIRNNYDVFHCHHVLTGFISSLVLPRKKIILSYMNDGMNNLKGRLRLLSPFIIWYLNNIILWKIYKTKIPKNAKHNSFYLPNGVNLNFFKKICKQDSRKLLTISNDELAILFVSANSIRPEKRFDIYNKVVDLLEEDGIKVKKLVMSRVDRNDIPIWYSAADLMLLTSDFEGSPNALKEAMACELPILARDVGSVSDLLGDDFSSHLLTSSDPLVIKKSVDYALTNLDLDKTGANLRKRIIDLQLDEDSIAYNIFKVYLKINNS